MQGHEERENGMARKLFPYDRESFSTQEAGTSVQRQREMIQGIAAEYQAVIDDSYALSDRGVSGFNGRNVKKKLGLFIRLCDEGVVRKGDLLCIERVNRLSRMVWTQQVKLWERILALGVEIVTCEPRGHYTQKNIGKLSHGCPLAILMMLGHEESQQKSDWIRYAHKIARENAMATGKPHGKRAPRWLRPVGTPHPRDPNRRITTAWEVIEERKRTILQLHQWCWDGLGVDAIVARLEKEQAPYWGKEGRWTEKAVRHHLISRALLGYCEPNVRTYQSRKEQPPVGYLNYPPILTAEQYDRTQLAIASRRGTGGPRQAREMNLFAGLARSVDDRPLSVHYSKGAGGRNLRYLATRPQSVRVPYQVIQTLFLGSLRKLKPCDIDGTLQRDEWSEKTLTLQAELGLLRERHDELERQLNELPPQKWPASIVARIADLDEAIEKTDRQLKRAKLYGSTSARVETLTDTQSILEYLEGLGNNADREAALERLRVRLPVLLEGITIAVDQQRGHSKWIHLRVAYKGGFVDRYSLRIGQPEPPDVKFCGDW
jgi:hypothetical protein